MSAPRLQLQQLITTIYGLYGELWGGVIPVSTLIHMLESSGVAAPAARASISRLKVRGDLVSSQVQGRAAYALLDTAQDVFVPSPRVMAPSRSAPGAPWSLVVFSVPEAERRQRHALKRQLSQFGFGFVCAGVAVAPQHLLDEALHRLEALGLLGYVDCFDGAQYRDRGDIRDRVSEWWDLDSIEEMLLDFYDRYHDQGESFPEGEWSEYEIEREAFSQYVPMLSRWRDLPYRDPNLPLDYLPDGWIAPRTRQTFLRLKSLWAEPAQRFAERLAALD